MTGYQNRPDNKLLFFLKTPPLPRLLIGRREVETDQNLHKNNRSGSGGRVNLCEMLHFLYRNMDPSCYPVIQPLGSLE